MRNSPVMIFRMYLASSAVARSSSDCRSAAFAAAVRVSAMLVEGAAYLG